MASNKKGYNLPNNLDADREELTYPQATQHDHYSADTNADPEGSAERDRVTRDSWPLFVLENFYDDTSNLWGKPNPNSRPALRPLASYIMDCIRFSDISDDDQVALQKLQLNETEQTEALVASYTAILEAVPNGTRFEIMKSVANITTKYLASRAVAKATYFSATGKLTESHEPTPEYIERMQDRMFAAATDAAVWMRVHGDLWKYLQWSNTPMYYTENAIKLELHNKAAYFDREYRPIKPAVATGADTANFNVAC